ncbi:MAG: hypothetical protein IAC51_08830 [bacterium]|uniref:Lipoprotein n=1 Tax=Candidatus Aphodosoma intestinipullorum TaxID=2840674 RepID=A0A940DKT8_9BACT|nr:hypothetical protein [Candidatus Aphodosoma intestinipullorum]
MKLKLIAIAACAAMLLAATACGGKKAEETSGSNAAKETAKISAMQVDDVLAHADTLVGKTVTLEGVCTHICSHGGRKIFLMGSDDTQTIRIEGGRIGKFAPECVNKVVTVEGIVREDRIDEEYLRRWEERLAAGTEEHHGTGEAGCNSEKKARQETGRTPEERIADFRTRIARSEQETGRAYLSFYHIEAISYTIAE